MNPERSRRGLADGNLVGAIGARQPPVREHETLEVVERHAVARECPGAGRRVAVLARAGTEPEALTGPDPLDAGELRDRCGADILELPRQYQLVV